MPSTVHLGLETPQARPGGLNHYLSELCRALRTMGAPVEAVVTGDSVKNGSGGEDFPFAIAAPVVTAIPWRIFKIWVLAVRLGRNSDIVDSHFALSALSPTAVGPLRRLPLVVHFQGPWADESATVGGARWACWVKRQIERIVYRRATSFVGALKGFRRFVGRAVRSRSVEGQCCTARGGCRSLLSRGGPTSA